MSKLVCSECEVATLDTCPDCHKTLLCAGCAKDYGCCADCGGDYDEYEDDDDTDDDDTEDGDDGDDPEA